MIKETDVGHIVTTNGTTHSSRSRPPWWRRRRVLFIGLGVVLLGAVVLTTILTQSRPPATPAAPVQAPLVAHGQILPTRQARVGTQAGGVMQRLDVTPGVEVAAQTPLAWVVGPTGTEVITAPFAGTVTNVLVHAGDTLVPGATIAVVADLHQLQVETSDVDEFLVGNVTVGQRVQLNVDALDDLALTGIVTSVAMLPQISGSGTPAYPVVISVSGLPPEVRAGMSVRVTFPEAPSPRA